MWYYPIVETNRRNHMSTVEISKRTGYRTFDYNENKSTFWVTKFSDGSEFDRYNTKKAALEDAKKYGLTVAK